MRQFILLFSIVLISVTVPAQTECSQYHKKGCGDNDGAFMKYDGQSKSAIMAKGQTSEFHLVAYDGQDYRITVCSEDNLGNEIRFKIYEKRKEFEKVKAEEVAETEGSSENYDDDGYEDYSEEDYSDDSYGEEEASPSGNKRPQFQLIKELLYDNSQDAYSSFIEFTAEGSMSLIIEVSVPGEESKMKLKVRETGCVGVLIEHIKSKNTGF